MINKSTASYTKLLKQIQSLERMPQELVSYQDELTKIFAVEYGVDKLQNLGIQFLYKKNKFQSNTDKSQIFASKEIYAFYKIKCFEDSKYIFTFQLIVTFSQHPNNYQFSYAFLLLSGISKKFRLFSIFAGNSFTFGQNLNKLDKDIYHTLSTTKGIKFKNGIMVVNFIKYYIRRKNYSYVYTKIVCIQLLVIKDIRFDNLKQSSLIIQLGYFVDKSLIKPNYRISRVTFSI